MMVDPMGSSKPRFPVGLLDWAGHRTGGVRKIFYGASGRPSGEIIRTPLLARLETWSQQVANLHSSAPEAVLLVGGPGNGKTEAIEFTIRSLDRAFNLDGRLINALQNLFIQQDGQPPPRLASVNISTISNGRINCILTIVQDATVRERTGTESAAASLVADLKDHQATQTKTIYLACVNRGVLDDALIYASDTGQVQVRDLIARIVQSVGLSPEPPVCWPLEGYNRFAVWPMDVETLVENSGEELAPADQLIGIATSASSWPVENMCAAGEQCPFCLSRGLLASSPHRESMLRILRFYELASGKRWSFRDLSTLLSFLLSGVPPKDSQDTYDPCAWAAKLARSIETQGARQDSLKWSAPYLLVAAQYQHALFGRWPNVGLRGLRSDIQDLNLQGDPTLMGLYYFLVRAKKLSAPTTLESQLTDLSELLDPAIADPDLKVAVSARTEIPFREIDTRFSQSILEGRLYIQKYQCLSPMEIGLLKLMEVVDQKLSDEEIRRKKPAIAIRVQSLLRDFACRVVRRSIGVRAGVVRDALILMDYQSVNAGDPQLIHDAVRQVEALINEKERFVVTLNTTFGEPIPPMKRRARLITEKQRVRPLDPPQGDRPRTAVRFMRVGAIRSGQPIPLTYDLFKAVKDLKKGMIPASLPKPVIALLDTTRAKLAGQIVRDEDLLEGGSIRIGTSQDKIVREMGAFLVGEEAGE